MQAVILAGGMGSRLRPLTNDTPKPMVKINDTPILEYTLNILPEEIDEIIITVSYKKEKIIEYFGDSFGAKPITYVSQPEPKGTGNALERAKPHLKTGRFLLLYGDDLYHPDDLSAVVKSEEPVVLVKETDEPEKFGVCLVDEEGYLRGVIEKSNNPPSNLVNIGVYLLDETIFDVPMVQLPNGEYNLTLQIGDWAKKRKVKTIKARFWHPIGFVEDVEAAHAMLTELVEERVD